MVLHRHVSGMDMQVAMLGMTLVGSMVGFIYVCGVNFLFCIILNLHIWISRLTEHLVSLVEVCEL